MIYLIAILLTCFFAVLYQKNREKINAYDDPGHSRRRQAYGIALVILTFLPLYLMNSSMSYVGADYQNYVLYFNRIAQGLSQDVDIAYKLINILVIRLGLDFQWIYFIVCFIAYTLLWLCLRKYTKNMWIGYLFFALYGFLFLLGMNQIRQFVAVALVCLSLQFIAKRRPILFVACVLLAASFHFTALVVLPFYLLFHKPLKFSAFFVLSLVGLPFNFVFTRILSFLFATFLPRYMNSNYVSASYRLDVPYLFMVWTMVMVVLAYRKELIKKPVNVVFVNCALLSGVLATFYSWLPEYKRFVYYFMMPAIFLIPQIFEMEKNKKRKWILLLFQVAVCLFYLKMASGTWKVFPYRSIFSS